MNDLDYKFFKNFLQKESGMAITPEKVYLLESRLLPIVQQQKIEGGLEGLAQQIRSTKDVELQGRILNFRKGILIGTSFDDVDNTLPTPTQFIAYIGKDITGSDFSSQILSGIPFTQSTLAGSNFSNSSIYNRWYTKS